jgi:hypothetical protein
VRNWRIEAQETSPESRTTQPCDCAVRVLLTVIPLLRVSESASLDLGWRNSGRDQRITNNPDATRIRAVESDL